MTDYTQAEYELACSFRPYTEKDRVKRTNDTLKALLKLQNFRDDIDRTLQKLSSGEVLSELDADVVFNMNVPEVSSLIRPHATERHWEGRCAAAHKIVLDDVAKQNKALRPWAYGLIKPYKPHRNLEAAKAFLKVFVTTGTHPIHTWQTNVQIPTQAWYRYFESVYRTNPEENQPSTRPMEAENL